MIADAMGWKLDRDHRRHPAEDRRPRRSSSEFLAVDPGLRLRHHPGRRRLPQGRAGDHAAHGGVPRRARVVRRGGDRRLAGAQDEDRRRRPRRHRHRVDRRQLDPEGPGGGARPAHDARHPPAVVLRRRAREAGPAVRMRRRGGPQRRRFRNSPFREMPSRRAAFSTRPCARSSARRTIACSSSSTASGSG